MTQTGTINLFKGDNGDGSCLQKPMAKNESEIQRERGEREEEMERERWMRRRRRGDRAEEFMIRGADQYCW